MKLFLPIAMVLLLFPNGAHAHDPLGLIWERANTEDAANTELPYANFEQMRQLRAYQVLGNQDWQRSDYSGEFGAAASDGFETVFIDNYKWPDGHILRVCFFDGVEREHRQILGVFDEILSYTNLSLAVHKSKCPQRGMDLQILVRSSGCYSTYGRSSLSRIRQKRTNETMGLCGAVGEPFTERMKGTIRHEFLHALGFVHEHQHPNKNCAEEIDRSALEKMFFPNGAEEERVEEFFRVNVDPILVSVPDAQLILYPYDNKSVLHYILPERAFKDPKSATCVLAAKNTELSIFDRRMLRQMYPALAEGAIRQRWLGKPSAWGQVFSETAKAFGLAREIQAELLASYENCRADVSCSPKLEDWVASTANSRIIYKDFDSSTSLFYDEMLGLGEFSRKEVAGFEHHVCYNDNQCKRIINLLSELVEEHDAELQLD